MRTVYKARIVPDTAPDGLTTKVIKVEDLGVPTALAIGCLEAMSNDELAEMIDVLVAEELRRAKIDVLVAEELRRAK